MLLLYAGESLLKPELPDTPCVIGLRIRRAGEARCFDPLVDRPGEAFVFDDADGLAGEVGKPLPLPGLLDAAGFHPENTVRCALFDNLLIIDPGVEAVAEGQDKGRDSSAGSDPEALHDPLGLYYGEAPPCFSIQVHSCFQSEAVFYSPKPEPVVGQPIESPIPEKVEEFLFGEILQILMHSQSSLYLLHSTGRGAFCASEIKGEATIPAMPKPV